MGLFKRRRTPAADTSGLGRDLVALRLDAGAVAPAPCTVVVFNPAGHARRLGPGRVACDEGEVAYGFHPGPYSVDLLPFAAAPEMGLRLRFVIDAANPRVTQQRFDLYLFSEAGTRLALSDFGLAAQDALQTALEQGGLELPPCTSLDEWNAFRAGLNQLLYTRFGVTVDDCVPVDLGDTADFAEILRARAASDATSDTADEADVQAAVTGQAVPIPAAAFDAATRASSPIERAAVASHAEQDARALRRLFLELPALSGALRVLVLPPGMATFQSHRTLLQRLGLISLSVGTMPSLAWAAPDQPLAPTEQQRRTTHAQAAVGAMDEAWSLLARLQLAGPAQWPELFDEADRICANLEFHLAQRRVPFPPGEDEGAARREPSL